jgi:hypothetical protein
VIDLERNFPKPVSLPTKDVARKDYASWRACLAIHVGTKVKFPHFDCSYHNIFFYSPAKRFDLGRYPPGETPPSTVTFDTAGLVTLRSDIHEYTLSSFSCSTRCARQAKEIVEPQAEFRIRKRNRGPDWARTSDPALIKRML